MSHALVRSLNVPTIVRLISEKYKLSENEALDRFYKSTTGASYSDDSTGLYGQSALFVFGMFCEEIEELCDDAIFDLGI